MPESSTDLNTAESQTYDAHQLAEEIAAGEQKAPKVNLDADYEAAQEMSVSSVDQSGQGAGLAEAATAPELKIPEPKSTVTEAQPTGNPDDYREMVHDIHRVDQGAVTSVSDELVEKALEKGQPGQ